MNPLMLVVAALCLPASAAPDAVPEDDIPVSTAAARSDAADRALQPIPESAGKRVRGIQSRYEGVTGGALEQRETGLNRLYEGRDTAAPRGAPVRGEAGPGGPSGPRGAFRSAPRDMEPLLKALDHYKETRAMRQSLLKHDIQVEMKEIPDLKVSLGISVFGGTAAYYDNELDKITLNMGYDKAAVTSTLPTFYHEAKHAEWYHMGLEDMVIENEFHSWTMANHLNYEIFKDPQFQKDFEMATRPLESDLREREAQQDGETAWWDKSWPVVKWREMKDWVSSTPRGRMKATIAKRPDLFYGTMAEAHNYSQFCRGQTEFFKGIGGAYVEEPDGQNNIASMRKQLQRELDATKQSRPNKPLQVRGKGHYLLIMRPRSLAGSMLRIGSPLAIVEGDRTATADIGNGRPVTVRLAVGPEKRAKALKYLQSFAPSEGLLLVFEDDGVHTLSMEGIWTNVDVAFVGGDGKVREIYSGIPGDDWQVRSEADIREAMVKLEKTDIYWTTFRQEDAAWRKEHADYCSHPAIKKVLHWEQRIGKALGE